MELEKLETWETRIKEQASRRIQETLKHAPHGIDLVNRYNTYRLHTTKRTHLQVVSRFEENDFSNLDECGRCNLDLKHVCPLRNGT